MINPETLDPSIETTKCKICGGIIPIYEKESIKNYMLCPECSRKIMRHYDELAAIEKEICDYEV